MRKKQFGKSARTFRAFYALALLIQNGTREEIRAKIASMQRARIFRGKKQAQSMLKSLARVVDTGAPVYSVFALNGNGKLPFVSFSSLPGVTCPGAGDCLEFCYSFQSWRFAHAFGRQAQNAFLLRFSPQAIRAELDAVEQKQKRVPRVQRQELTGLEFSAVKPRAPLIMRLYVDGDFSSVGDVQFWFSELNARPHIEAYGYSKSFAELLAYAGKLPENYRLNISSGHSHDSATVEKIRALSITRGEFRAVSIGRKVKSAEHGTREVNAAIRAHSSDKVFACPGKCGSCIPHGHACGSARFTGIPIAIAIH